MHSIVTVNFNSYHIGDLDAAMSLFKKYILCLTNQLATPIDRLFTRCKQTTRLYTATDVNIAAMDRQEINRLVNILRTARDLNHALSQDSCPQTTRLFTVIRSPHVFKKTREQFAKTHHRRVVSLLFRSRAATQLFVDSLILLRLSAELKINITSQ